MPLAIRIDEQSRVPLQDQVVREIAISINAAQLRPGERLPGTRALAEQLRISRNTILNAYQRLSAEGYLVTREGGGTFVADNPPELSIYAAAARKAALNAPLSMTQDRGFRIGRDADTDGNRAKPICDFQLEALDASAFPQTTWRRLMLRRMQSSKFNLTRSGEPGGYPPLRESIALFLAATRGLDVEPKQVLVVTGIQQALNVIAQLFVRSGTKVVMEAPCCGIAQNLFLNYGAQIVSLPVDDEGARLDALPKTRGCLAFVTPTRQYPIGAAMSKSRQDALIAWAERTNSHIVEVDFDGDFHYEGRPAMALMSRDKHDRVSYVASFSSTLGPGLRIGYMAMPDTFLDSAAEAVMSLEYGFPCSGFPWIEQAVLNDFMVSGGYDRLLKRLRRTYRSRRDAVVAGIQSVFGKQDIRGTDCGTHLIWRLSQDLPDAAEFQAIARQSGVVVYTLDDASVASRHCIADNDRILLLGFAACSETAISSSLALLGVALGRRRQFSPA
jgi:GntR family transcriptional regulator/MocR family aminotransferase